MWIGPIGIRIQNLRNLGKFFSTIFWYFQISRNLHRKIQFISRFHPNRCQLTSNNQNTIRRVWIGRVRRDGPYNGTPRAALPQPNRWLEAQPKTIPCHRLNVKFAIEIFIEILFKLQIMISVRDTLIESIEMKQYGNVSDDADKVCLESLHYSSTKKC